MSSMTAARIAQIFGCASAAWLSGYIGSMTMPGMSAVSKAPPNVAPKQWRTIFDIGFTTAPKIAGLSASAFAYAAYSLSVQQKPASSSTLTSIYFLSAAAISTLMIAPWTILTMLPTNEKLDAKLAVAESGLAAKEDSELDGLLTKWARLNGIRSVFPLVGAFCGLWAITS
ncbi:uncharacterized protein PV09_07435 [Verruconis gallopava]|uniref:DUF1772 domain-containing protein n=1 Tax=Verruconis gallopava TaxID=253628 RepID=A0A0D2APR4_9PEZI|nr:uncharacterized protein PV09_07435 [Verruconis gallopava]KIW01149.1 hypothetical protein PV09_07435 [Verruconis gallopava]